MKSTERRAPRSPASGSVRDLETVAKKPLVGAKAKKAPPKPPKAGTSFKTAGSAGGHVAAPPSLASAHKKSKKRAPNEGEGKTMAGPPHQGLANSRTVTADSDKQEKRPKMTQAEQSAEFERVAREHGAEGSEAEFNGVLRKLAKAKTP